MSSQKNKLLKKLHAKERVLRKQKRNIEARLRNIIKSQNKTLYSMRIKIRDLNKKYAAIKKLYETRDTKQKDVDLKLRQMQANLIKCKKTIDSMKRYLARKYYEKIVKRDVRRAIVNVLYPKNISY